MKIQITFMSGVEDGTELQLNASGGDGTLADGKWMLTIGRRDENDVVLRNDTFVSRQHAKLHWQHSGWSLEDCQSTNGTFTENPDELIHDDRVTGHIDIEENQLFRVGRTWLRLETIE